MPGMPDLILKAPVFGRFAKASRLKGAAKSPLLDQLIQRLEGDPSLPANSLVQMALDMGFYASPQQAEHVRRDWLNDPPGNGFWPGIDTEALLREGLLTVCRKFKETRLPIEFFWVISGDQNTARWEMSVSRCKRCLVVMFHTPQFPCFVPTEPSKSMWIIREENGAVISRPVQVPVVAPPPAVAPASPPAKKKAASRAAKNPAVKARPSGRKPPASKKPARRPARPGKKAPARKAGRAGPRKRR